MEDAAAIVGAAFASQNVTCAQSSTLRGLLPGALFVRASVRCGMGLFVSDDLLQSGQLDLSVASLQHSLAGVAMSHGRPVVVATPASHTRPSVAQVICMPVGSLLAPSGLSSGDTTTTTTKPAGGTVVYVGALMVGVAESAAAGPPPLLWLRLEALAAAAAPYCLILAATKAAEMGQLLRLRAADCCCCPEGDPLQDLPLQVCTPSLMRQASGGSGTAGAQAAHLSKRSAEAGTLHDCVPAQAWHAAAAAALAQQSGLSQATAASPAVASPAAPPASGASGSGSSCSTASEPSCAAPLEASHGCYKGQQLGAAACRKLKKRRLLARQHLAAAASTATPPTSGLLLRYCDPQLEARFAAAHNVSLSCSDALFARMHLAATLCFAALHPAVAVGSRTLFVWGAAMAALLGLLTCQPGRYSRHRESVLTALLVANALMLHNSGLPALSVLLPPHSQRTLPWVVRSSGAAALAMFGIGFKLRFCRFLPVQGLCLGLVAAVIAAPCPSPLAFDASTTSACVPRGLARAAMALLLALGGLLPAAAIWVAEVRARRRFQAALLAMR